VVQGEHGHVQATPYVEFRRELPKTSAGKIHKIALVEEQGMMLEAPVRHSWARQADRLSCRLVGG